MTEPTPVQNTQKLRDAFARLNLNFDNLDNDVDAAQALLDTMISAVAGDTRWVNELDHTKAAHDALGIDAATLGGTTLTALVTEAEHTKALHDALGINAATLGGSASSAFLLASQRGASNGVAELVSGLLPTSRLPALAINDTYTVASQAAMLALSNADRGDMAIRTDFTPNRAYVLAADDETVLANWIQITAQGAVVSVNGQSGIVNLSASDVGALTQTTANALYSALGHAHSGEEITSGTVDVARIGTGTKDSTTYYNGLGAFSVPPTGSGTASGTVTASSLGIAPGNTAAANRTALIALSNTSHRIVFEVGDYAVDNTTPPNISGFTGAWIFKNGARLVYNDNAKKGFTFTSCHGMTVHGMSIGFSTLPPLRIQSQEAITFWFSNDVKVYNYTIHGSPSVGLLFGACDRPSVIGAWIRNTMADGLHFANCVDPHAHNIVTEDTGDDGLAFVNYGDNSGFTTKVGKRGHASSITVRRSDARGISSLGQSEVRVSGFTIEETNGPGIIIGYDSSFRTHVPQNCVFSGGTITRAGQTDFSPGGNNAASGVPHGIFSDFAPQVATWAASTSKSVGAFVRPVAGGSLVYRAALVNGTAGTVGATGTTGATEPVWPTARYSRVVDGTVTWEAVDWANTFENIEVFQPKSRGFHGINVAGKTRVHGLRVIDAGDTGMTLHGNIVEISNIYVDNAFKPAIVLQNVAQAFVDNVTARNVSRDPADTLARAFNFENGYNTIANWTTPTVSRIAARGLRVCDDRATVKAHAVNAAAQTGFSLVYDLGEIQYHTISAFPTQPWSTNAQASGTVERRYSGAQQSTRATVPSAAGDGRYFAGDRVKHSAPAASTTPGWICTASGNPGTFKAEASLGA